MSDLDLLRDLLSKYEVWYQWTGPHSKVEEPWKRCPGFTFHSQLQYQLRPQQPQQSKDK